MEDTSRCKPAVAGQTTRAHPGHILDMAHSQVAWGDWEARLLLAAADQDMADRHEVHHTELVAYTEVGDMVAGRILGEAVAEGQLCSARIGIVEDIEEVKALSTVRVVADSLLAGVGSPAHSLVLAEGHTSL